MEPHEIFLPRRGGSTAPSNPFLLDLHPSRVIAWTLLALSTIVRKVLHGSTQRRDLEIVASGYMIFAASAR